MIFYKITTRKTKSEDSGNIEKQKYREISETLFQDLEENAYIAVSEISEFTCTLIAAVKPEMAHKYTAKALVDEFNRASSLDLLLKKYNEVSLVFFKRALRRAENDEYIESEDKVISDLHLECDCRYKEAVSKDISKKEAKELAQELLYDNSLSAEIDRIYQVKNKSEKLHHPVHYIIRSDHEDDYREIIDCLVSALYDNNRLFSKRYSEIEVYSYMDRSRQDLIRLYSIQRGGTVVLKLEPSRGEESALESDRLCEHIERIGRVINKFSHDVLTIFVMPQVCEKETEAIFKNTEPIFVEITPENASGKRAKKYLDYKARKADVTATDTLYKDISEEKAFTANELSEQFALWYSDYVRSEMFPQYKELKKKITSENDKRFGKALKDLDDMIGLDNAKKVIYNALDYYKVQKLYKQFGKRSQSPSMHMVFTGNPGTAKTTVARLFAQILKDNDVITNGKLIEVGRADLVGKYVGHTAPLVRNAFEAAEGGVLFIDEAYSLLEDKGGMYGDEAINTIVQEMENRRNETIVILAGYPKEMEDFLDRNPGLKSRIAFHIPFEDYTADELTKITELMAKNTDNRIEKSAIGKLNSIFNEAVKVRNFGNGRYARNIIEKAEMKRASRLSKMRADEVTKDMLETFVSEDFESDIKQAKNEKYIGFAVQ